MGISDLEWYWWLVIAAVLALSIPIKIKFMKWWSRHRQDKKEHQCGKWENPVPGNSQRYCYNS